MNPSRPAVRGRALASRLALLIALALAPALLFAAAFGVWVYAGVRDGGATPAGTLAGFNLTAPVHIVRDERGIPHVIAHDERDAYFAEGYLQGTDRLFQLDVYRRLVAGRLAEIFGTLALQSDLDARVIDIAAIARAQAAQLPRAERDDLQAFANGVNAAIATRPLPPEFRLLAYRPEPWTPEDSLVASFATVLALTDSWYDVANRDAIAREAGPRARDAFFSISDPAYDTPTTGRRIPAPVAPLPPLALPHATASPLYVAAGDARSDDARAGLGSNNAALGAALTATHRAIVESDPHLELRIPGVWWLVDLEAPGLHVAGATLPGVPGVILGHNDHIAWGATNGTVATVVVYREHFTSPTSDEYRANGALLHAEHRREVFGVRFGKPVVHEYLRTRHGFVFDDGGTEKLAAAWTADTDRRSSLTQFDALDRATSAADAMRALAAYPGPPQNFAFADDRGNAGYALAGEIPNDDAWGLVARDGATSGAPARSVPFAQLPHVAPGRSALAFTANDRVYDRGYPFRLSAAFSPPYRASRIALHLAKPPFDIATLTAVQADVTSPAERELAAAGARALARAHAERDPDLGPALAALRSFDGRFTSDSRGAVFVTALRRASAERLVRMHLSRNVGLRYLADDGGSAYVAVMRMLRERPHGWVPADDYDAFLVAAMRDGIAGLRARGQFDATWSVMGARTAQHALASFGLHAWNGVPFPGLGSAYSPHVQAPANAQSFRAVWDVGNWNAGGIVIPQGESGEPGSPHYRDLAATWLRGNLVPLPFGDAAVARAAHETLDLTP